MWSYIYILTHILQIHRIITLIHIMCVSNLVAHWTTQYRLQTYIEVRIINGYPIFLSSLKFLKQLTNADFCCPLYRSNAYWNMNYVTLRFSLRGIFHYSYVFRWHLSHHKHASSLIVTRYLNNEIRVARSCWIILQTWAP